MRQIGIVGCGAVVDYFYAKILPSLASVRVAGVCDRSPERAAAAAALLGTDVQDFQQLAAAVDLLIIATPPRSHFQLAQEAMGLGADVFVEKPFVTSRQEAEALCTLAERAGRRILVGQFRRYFPHLNKARDFLATGLLGKVTGLEMFEGGRFAWEAQTDYVWKDPLGGVLFDTGAHTLDMALYACALDSPECSLAGIAGVIRDKAEPAHEIDARFTLRGGDSSPIGCRLFLSRLQMLANRVRITCERGTLEFGVLQGDPVRVRAGDGSLTISERNPALNNLAPFQQQLEQAVHGEPAGRLSGRRFISQIGILEAIYSHQHVEA